MKFEINKMKKQNKIWLDINLWFQERKESKRKKITDAQVFKIHTVLNESENWTPQTGI